MMQYQSRGDTQALGSCSYTALKNAFLALVFYVPTGCSYTYSGATQRVSPLGTVL